MKRVEPALAGVSVLVVDDDSDSAGTMALLLQQYGAKVDVAHCAEEAIVLLRERTPRVLLVDMLLPDMSGHELARRVLGAEGHPPVLFALTGCVSAADEQQALHAGFSRYFRKPVVLEELLKALAEVDAG